MTLLANILTATRGTSPWVFSITRPRGMSFLTFAVLCTFAYRTLNGKGILGRALSGGSRPAAPRTAKRAPRRKALAS